MSRRYLLVTGGRFFNDWDMLSEAMSLCGPIDFVFHGGSKGADTLAKRWCQREGVHCADVSALWSFSGKKAGPIRNTAMLDVLADLAQSPGVEVSVLAFPGGKGTRDCVEKARRLGLRVHRIGVLELECPESSGEGRPKRGGTHRGTCIV